MNQNDLIILGISAATTGAARLIDVSDQSKSNLTLNINQPGQNFFIDILSDLNGISIHRFQAVVFNITLGVWYIYSTLHNLNGSGTDLNSMLPDIGSGNLVLLGISATTYAALKSKESKS